MKASLLVLALLVTGQARADTVYNNTALVNSAIGPFGHSIGSSATSTYGETFLAPATDTVLNTFSLFLNAGTTGQIQGYIVSWNGTGVGSILYSSGLTAVTGAAQEFDFSTGGLNLTAGDSYAAVLSIDGSEYFTDSGTTTMPGVRGTASIPGGSFIYQNDGVLSSQFTVLPWTNYGSNFEAELIASFSPDPPAASPLSGADPLGFDPPDEAPEPASFLLLGSGLVFLHNCFRRKPAIISEGN
ncbi:MAG: PEP-CTERM sorting domain-containing protein [Terracidiphilus sp.]